MKNRKLVAHSVIVAAKNGDPEAMGKILKHYNGLIEYHSRRTTYDKYGTPHTAIDPDIKDRIQTKIIEKIISDFDPYRIPSGEGLKD